MIKLGKINSLTLVKQQGPGIYLEGGQKRILLADGKLPEGLQTGDDVKAFVYVDSEGQLAASTRLPRAQVDEVAWLRATAVNYYGAFLDWGLPKELLVPFGEQLGEMQVGKFYLVRLFLDAQGRIAATAKIDKFIANEVADADEFKPGQEVALLIADATDLGFKAIVNHRYWGLLYSDELFQPLKKGQKLTGYIKQIRDDKKIDLTLNQPGYAKIDPLAEQILKRLQSAGGTLPLGDKSPPEAVRREFNASKKAFKQAIGALYKQHLIIIGDHDIRLV